MKIQNYVGIDKKTNKIMVVQEIGYKPEEPYLYKTFEEMGLPEDTDPATLTGMIVGKDNKLSGEKEKKEYEAKIKRKARYRGQSDPLFIEYMYDKINNISGWEEKEKNWIDEVKKIKEEIKKPV